jgi:uncharacterized Zn finger protein (UPF0148 family)
MSENFDKEAERKRLREKYESDSGDREVTERMSQLLLQGATMTNTHCDTCGSPIFRYQGQAFCPTCQAEAEAAEQGAQPATANGSGSDSADATGTQPADAETSGTQSAGDETGGSTDTGDAVHESVGTASTGTAELGGRTGAEPALSGAESPVPDAMTRSLAETIVSLSDRARETEDPTRAKALLEAAREAAETLARVQGR